LIHRNARPDDPHFGKYNGLGGKLEPGEDVVAGLRREVREEAGIACEELHLAGTISWPGFGKDGAFSNRLVVEVNIAGVKNGSTVRPEDHARCA
jgi:8-oxo-dGTP diphosphatase